MVGLWVGSAASPVQQSAHSACRAKGRQRAAQPRLHVAYPRLGGRRPWPAFLIHVWNGGLSQLARQDTSCRCHQAVGAAARLQDGLPTPRPAGARRCRRAGLKACSRLPSRLLVKSSRARELRGGSALQATWQAPAAGSADLNPQLEDAVRRVGRERARRHTRMRVGSGARTGPSWGAHTMALRQRPGARIAHGMAASK